MKISFYFLTTSELSRAERRWWKERLDFENHCSTHLYSYFEFSSKIVFSDDCMLRISGVVNKENVRIWGADRPEEHNLFSWIVQVLWYGPLFQTNVSQAVFEKKIVTRDTYQKIPIHYEFTNFKSLTEDFILQQDADFTHYFNPFLTYLNSMGRNQWIWRGCPVSWPPRSSDLTACNFYPWSYIK